MNLESDIEELACKEVSPKMRVKENVSVECHRGEGITEVARIHTGQAGTRSLGQDSHPDAGEFGQL